MFLFGNFIKYIKKDTPKILGELAIPWEVSGISEKRGINGEYELII
jgi:hypothetical protein